MSVGEPPFQREITQLYSEHHGWLLTKLRRKLGYRQNAADLAQATSWSAPAGISDYPIKNAADHRK
jgi:DNA-directed RNA polymerase specialized sigma24 family protein